MEPSIAQVLQWARQTLAGVTQVPDLEGSVLLCHLLNVPRSYLFTWPEKKLTTAQHDEFVALINKRLLGQPIAYLIGHQEFWSLDLIVTPAVLIPRADTELLVELVLEKISASQAVIADLGTGSGAISLALAHERPQWIIHAADNSIEALKVAKLNAKRLGATNISFHTGSWLGALPRIQFDAIISNPPYIARQDPHLLQGDLRFEPQNALIADEEGLKDIKEIILAAKHYLKPNGLVFLEHGYNQAGEVRDFFQTAGYTQIEIYQDLAAKDRVTIASWTGFDIDYIS